MAHAQIKCVPFMGQCCPIFFFQLFMALGHEWHTHRLNVCHSWVSAAQFFFFQLFMALDHEWHMHRLNVCRSWVSAAQFFFFQKEHNASMNGTYEFINFNLLPSMDVLCSFWTPKKCWHLYKTKHCGIYTTTHWHLYKKKHCGIYT